MSEFGFFQYAFHPFLQPIPAVFAFQWPWIEFFQADYQSSADNLLQHGTWEIAGPPPKPDACRHSIVHGHQPLTLAQQQSADQTQSIRHPKGFFPVESTRGILKCHLSGGIHFQIPFPAYKQRLSHNEFPRCKTSQPFML